MVLRRGACATMAGRGQKEKEKLDADRSVLRMQEYGRLSRKYQSPLYAAPSGAIHEIIIIIYIVYTKIFLSLHYSFIVRVFGCI